MYPWTMAGSNTKNMGSSTVRTVSGDTCTTYRRRFAGSDIIHLQAFGSHIVVVNSVKAANELFEKRSRIYSDK